MKRLYLQVILPDEPTTIETINKIFYTIQAIFNQAKKDGAIDCFTFNGFICCVNEVTNVKEFELATKVGIVNDSIVMAKPGVLQ